jgi:hypothetical protein
VYYATTLCVVAKFDFLAGRALTIRTIDNNGVAHFDSNSMRCDVAEDFVRFFTEMLGKDSVNNLFSKSLAL